MQLVSPNARTTINKKKSIQIFTNFFLMVNLVLNWLFTLNKYLQIALGFDSYEGKKVLCE